MTSYIQISGFDPESGFLGAADQVIKQALPHNGYAIFIASRPSEFKANDQRTAKFSSWFKAAGVDFKKVALLDYRTTIAPEKSLLHNAACLFLMSGDTQLQMAFIEELGIVEDLKNYRGTMIGVSAGAINMARLGLSKLHVVPHFQRVTQERLEQIILPRSYNTPLYGMHENGVILQQGGATKFYGDIVEIKEGQSQQVSYAFLEQNKQSWDLIADDWFGTTALPVYGKKTPGEETLGLFGNLIGKTVLDIGCGSGHSLHYMASKGATELWGLDLSEKQIENAQKHLRAQLLNPKLFNAPMETNPGIPLGHFDVVYSIYALGWTLDLDQTISLVASYLKPNGIFVFSWDHPLMKCVAETSTGLQFEGSYHEEDHFSFKKGDQPLTVQNRKMSSYINTLAKYGLYVEQLVETVDQSQDAELLAFSSAYYSETKASKLPLSFIIKARKIK